MPQLDLHSDTRSFTLSSSSTLVLNMALLDFINARDKSTAATPSQTQSALDAPSKKPTEAPATAATPLSDDPVASKGASSPPTSDSPPVPESDAPPVAVQPDSATSTPNTDRPRWSFQGYFKLHRKPNSPRSTVEKHDAAVPTATSTDRTKPPALSHADQRAKKSALIVRSLIVGQDTDEGGVASPPRERVSSAQLKSVKAQLLEPKTACRVIRQLRALPALLSDSASRASEPIQAVCLPYNDEEADKKHLSNIRGVKVPATATTATTTTTTTPTTPSSPPVRGATIDTVIEAFRNLHIVSLFTAPDLGLGEPGDGPGLLAGAVPTAETVLNGVTEITPQLMALGYATGKTLMPNHKGIYPPTDRMSILTCTSVVDHHVAEISNVRYVDWWGLELLLPPPTLAYLSVSFHALISA
jgi:hypothetical protein